MNWKNDWGSVLSICAGVYGIVYASTQDFDSWKTHHYIRGIGGVIALISGVPGIVERKK